MIEQIQRLITNIIERVGTQGAAKESLGTVPASSEMKKRFLFELIKLLSLIIIILSGGVLFWRIHNCRETETYSIFEGWQVESEKEVCVSNIKIAESSEKGVGVLTFEVKHGLVRSVCFREDAKSIHFYLDVVHKKAKHERFFDDKNVDLLHDVKRVEYRIPWQKGQRLIFWTTLLTNVLIEYEGEFDECL